MMTNTLRIGAFMIVFFTSFIYFVPQKYEKPLPLQPPLIQITNLTEASSTFNASVVEFWKHLTIALVDAKPKCKPLNIIYEDSLQPDDRREPSKPTKKRLSGFTDQDETALLRAHYIMRRSAQYLAHKLPYSEGTTGIVTTATLDYMPVLIVSLRMLRRTGCNLPVEVYIDDWTQYSRPTCDMVFPSLHARCIVLSDMPTNATQIQIPNHDQNKIHSILFSSFQNVLYLDTDVFPTYDPTILFNTPPYTTHSLITWPDIHPLTVSEHFYHIAGIHQAPLSSTSSSQILINKGIHRESLLMAIYYNHYGLSYFHALGFTQKETFTHAALAMRLPIYHVHAPATPLGRWYNGTYRGVGTAHADPGMDYEYLAPVPSHMHPSAKWENIDLAHPDPAVEKALNYTRHAPRSPRPVFLHQYMLKMDPATVLKDKAELTFEPDGTPHRMWGLREDVVRVLGYDVEERLWGAVVEEGCREDRGSEGCRVLREYAREVVGWMESIDRPW